VQVNYLRFFTFLHGSQCGERLFPATTFIATLVVAFLVSLVLLGRRDRLDIASRRLTNAIWC
jgi:hypothetical protein